jgi:membrane protein
MAAAELESAEQRIAAARADLSAHVRGIKSEALKVAKSPYVIGGAVATVAAAGFLAFTRHQKQVKVKVRAPKVRVPSMNLGGTSALFKLGEGLLPLLGMLVGAKTAKPDPRSFPVVIEKPKGDAKAAAAVKRGFAGRQLDLIKQAFKAWQDDYAPSMGAALSYYTLFSLAPLLLIVIAVAGMVFGQEAAQGEILGQLRGIMGEEGAIAVEGMIEAANKPGKSALATIVGIALLLLGATAVFGELQSALDRIWRTPAPKKESGILHMLRTRLLSFGLVLGLGFLLMVSLVVSAGLSAFGKWYGGWFEGWEILLQVLNFAVSFGIFTVLFAMIYKLMPRAKISWHDVWTGAAVTALLFTVGKVLIGLYLGRSTMASGFGAAGSLVVMLAWVYYSAQIFLLGAEYTWVYANQDGSYSKRIPQGDPPAVPQRPQ